MPENNKDLPAYPMNYGLGHDGTLWNSYEDGRGGLTKRELIAAMCLQGLLGNAEWTRLAGGILIGKDAAERATTLADDLLNHLQNTDK